MIFVDFSRKHISTIYISISIDAVIENSCAERLVNRVLSCACDVRIVSVFGRIHWWACIVYYHCICAHQFWIAYAFHLFWMWTKWGPQQAFDSACLYVAKFSSERKDNLFVCVRDLFMFLSKVWKFSSVLISHWISNSYFNGLLTPALF